MMIYKSLKHKTLCYSHLKKLIEIFPMSLTKLATKIDVLLYHAFHHIIMYHKLLNMWTKVWRNHHGWYNVHHVNKIFKILFNQRKKIVPMIYLKMGSIKYNMIVLQTHIIAANAVMGFIKCKCAPMIVAFILFCFNHNR